MIGIIGAMDEEVEQIAANLKDARQERIAGMTFTYGELEGKDAVVVRSGIGKVNMALCAQILIDRFNADLLINTGVAGSLDARIDIGDIVIATDAVYHDMDATGFGDPAGQVPRMDVLSFPLSGPIGDLAEKCCAKVNPDIHTFRGRVLTGDQFVSAQETKDRITGLFGGLCTEMEGAAMAHAAYLNQVPALVIRAISDKADGSAHETYSSFEKKAIEHTVKLILELLKELIYAD